MKNTQKKLTTLAAAIILSISAQSESANVQAQTVDQRISAIASEIPSGNLSSSEFGHFTPTDNVYDKNVCTNTHTKGCTHTKAG